MQVYVNNMIGEIFCLVQVVLEVFKVVVEVVVELCQKLFDSMVCDIVMLDECVCLLGMLEILFDVVNYVLIEQCMVVDVLVVMLVDLLECVGVWFIDWVEVEIGKFGVVVVQVIGSVVEVVSLGEVFGVVVQLFGELNDKFVV